MRRIHIYLVLLVLPLWLGCTTQSSILARQANYDIQRVKDGIHREMFDAISFLIEEPMASDEQIEIDVYRVRLTEWGRDYDLANRRKAVTVNAYLYAQVGILNQLGEMVGISTHVPIKTGPATQPASHPALE